MRLHSTPESIDNEEISLLAVVETICSVVLYVFIAMKVIQSWTPIVIAVSIAPFLLLRTDLSTERGLRWYEAYLMRVGHINYLIKKSFYESIIYNNILSIFLKCIIIGVWLFLILLLIVISSFIIRTLSITLTALQHPLASLGAIPRNWVRLTLCIDFFHPPEIVQGLESLESPSPRLRKSRISKWINDLREDSNWIEKMGIRLRRAS